MEHNVKEEEVAAQIRNWTEFTIKKPPIGSGTFGEVFLGQWLGQNVVLKRLRSRHNPKNLLIKEINALTGLHHKHIVVAHCAAKDPEDNIYLVMEYSKNGSLHKRIHEDGVTLSRVEILQIGLDVAKALAYLHAFEPKIIHRDIKSQNILLYNKRSRAKIADFGSARFLSKEEFASTVAGSLGYMGPEIVNQRPYSEKVDVYAFGAVLYEMVSSLVDLPSADVNSRRRKIIEKVQDPDLQHLILVCCSHNPNDRPSMIQVVDKLKRMLKPSWAEIWESPAKPDWDDTTMKFHVDNADITVKFASSVKQVVKYEDKAHQGQHKGTYYVTGHNVVFKDHIGRESQLFNKIIVTSIALSSSHMLVLSVTRTIYSTGAPSLIGRQPEGGSKDSKTPTNELHPIRWLIKDGQRVSALGKFMFITCNEHQSAAVGADGQLYVWGYNRDSVVHVTDADWLVVPHHVRTANLAEVRFEKIALQRSDKFQVVLALSDTGNLYLSGMNYKYKISSPFIKLNNPTGLHEGVIEAIIAEDMCVKLDETVIIFKNRLTHKRYSCVLPTAQFVKTFNSTTNISKVVSLFKGMEDIPFTIANSASDGLFMIWHNLSQPLRDTDSISESSSSVGEVPAASTSEFLAKEDFSLPDDNENVTVSLIDAANHLEELSKEQKTSVNLRLFNAIQWAQHGRCVYAERDADGRLQIILVLSKEVKQMLMERYLFIDTFDM